MTPEHKKSGIHYAWIIMVCMILIQGGATGILTNCLGVIFSAVLSDLGFRAGDLSLYYTIRSLTSAVAVVFTVKLFFRKNTRLVMVILGLLMVSSYGAMAFFHSLWQWYLAAVLFGIGMSCNMVVIPVVINNWFRVKNGAVIGVTMASSGVCGAIFSPLCSSLISMYGWRSTVLILAGISSVMILLPSMLLLYADPADRGDLPYGESADRGTVRADEIEVPQPPSYIFGVCVLTIMLSGSLIQFNSQLPTFAQSIGYPLSVGAMFTSLSMIGNLAGKVISGVLTDRIGVYMTGFLFFISVSIGMLGYLFGTGNVAVLEVSSALYGMQYAVSMTLPSLLFLDLYGRMTYKDKLSRMQLINGLASACISAAFPYIYDLTGSYAPVFVMAIVFELIGFSVFLYLLRYTRRRANYINSINDR